MYVFEIRCTETGEVIETHETGAEAGARSRQLNDQLRDAGLDRRTRVKRVEAPAAEETEPWGYVFRGAYSLVLTSAEYASCYPETEKVAPIPSHEGYVWRDRETYRLIPSEIPWWSEDWWKNSPLLGLHFPHPSRVDPAKLAYTQSEDHGLNDRQTRTTPGRYLRRYFGNILTAEQIEYWAVAWTDKFSPRSLQFASTPEDIARVYENGPHSCMAYPAGSFNSPVHPCSIYGAGDLAVAYITDGDRITGRALVWPDRKVYGRIYGDVYRMETALEAEGFKQGRDGSFDGARLLNIPAGDVYTMPYLDYPLSAADDHGEFLILRSFGSITSERTDGLSDDAISCETCETTMHEDDAMVVDGWNPLYYCEECYHERYIICDDCNEPTYRDDATVVQGGDVVCEVCRDDRYSYCEGCDEYVHDSCFGKEAPDGNVYCAECRDDLVTECDGCGDEVMHDEVCPDCATGDTASDPVTSSKDPGACTCARNREAARAEAIAARDPLLARVGSDHRAEVFNAPADYARTVAELEDEQRIEAAVAAVPPCDSCLEQAGQLTLSFDAPAPETPEPEHTCAWRVIDDTGTSVPCGAPSTHRSTLIGDWYTLCEHHAVGVPSIMERFAPPPAPEPGPRCRGMRRGATGILVTCGAPATYRSRETHNVYCDSCAAPLAPVLDRIAPPPAPEPNLCCFDCGNVATRQGYRQGYQQEYIPGLLYCEDCAAAAFRFPDSVAPRIVTETVSTY